MNKKQVQYLKEIKAIINGDLGLGLDITTGICADMGTVYVKVEYFNGEKFTSHIEDMDKYFSVDLFTGFFTGRLAYLRADNKTKVQVAYSDVHPSQYDPSTFVFAMSSSWKGYEDEVNARIAKA